MSRRGRNDCAGFLLRRRMSGADEPWPITGSARGAGRAFADGWRRPCCRPQLPRLRRLRRLRDRRTAVAGLLAGVQPLAGGGHIGGLPGPRRAGRRAGALRQHSSRQRQCHHQYCRVDCHGGGLLHTNDAQQRARPDRVPMPPIADAVELTAASAGGLSGPCGRQAQSLRRQHATRLHPDLPGLRLRQGRDHADRRLPVLLRLRWLRHPPQAEGRRLLRVLLLRLGALPSSPGGRKMLRRCRMRRPMRT